MDLIVRLGEVTGSPVPALWRPRFWIEERCCMDEAKLELVQSWFRKASHDLAAARLLAHAHPPLLDVATYHCQQAAEKALKGYLVFWDQEWRRLTIWACCSIKLCRSSLNSTPGETRRIG